jgi:3-deoxy-D-manno-octulosonic acid kinase
MAGSSDILFLHPRYSDLPGALKETLFEPDQLKAAGLVTRELKGRGTTYFYKLREHRCVLRHYWRGGIIQNFSADSYIWLGLSRTRSYREWQLLEIMENLRLPTPRRVALRIQRHGLFYRSDIVTEEILNVTSLAQLLQEREAIEDEWNCVGQSIRKFHDKKIFQQDLNANNLLLGPGTCHLIDFDRGRLQPGDWWHERVLDRLKRSLVKLKGKHNTFHYNAMSWSYLQDGYAQSSE